MTHNSMGNSATARTGSSLFYVCRNCSHPIEYLDSTASELSCDRCGEKAWNQSPHVSIQHTLAYSLTALVFFIPANLFPFMTIELYGHRNSSTIWEGVVSLINDGSWPIALVVFLASLVIPLVKLLILFYLAATAKNGQNPKLKTKLYHFIEAIGRWSMLDIFLLGILVAIMKLGHWARVKPELGSLLFLLVVIFTMLASSSFDPRLLWRKENGNRDKNTKPTSA